MAYLYKGRKQEKKVLRENKQTARRADNSKISRRGIGDSFFCLIVWEGAVVRVFKASYVANWSKLIAMLLVWE